MEQKLEDKLEKVQLNLLKKVKEELDQSKLFSNDTPLKMRESSINQS